MLRILLTTVLVLYNVSITSSQEQGGQTQQVAASSCLAPKPKAMGGARYMKNGTNPGEYIVGANSWHIPVLDYLTKVIGPTYDPPIRFRRFTANNYLTSSSIEESMDIGYDFMIANPHASSCYESERSAVSLATQVFINQNPQKRRLSPEQQPQSYNLTKYGAALYVLKNRTDIRTVQDIKGKKIGTNKITNLAT